MRDATKDIIRERINAKRAGNAKITVRASGYKSDGALIGARESAGCGAIVATTTGTEIEDDDQLSTPVCVIVMGTISEYEMEQLALMMLGRMEGIYPGVAREVIKQFEGEEDEND